jgi:ABC-type transporter Mla MlaB component
VIAIATMGGAQPENPYSYFLHGQSQPTRAIVAGGDLRTIDTIRAFWQLTLTALADEPSAIWLNLTDVSHADTKLAACLVAILRRAQEYNTAVYIVGSNAVQDVLKFCKVPPLQLFTKVA